MKHLNCTKVARGFTLVELMITIAILAIIATIAAPNLSRQLASQRISDTASIVNESLKFAISESSIRRQSIRYSIDTQTATIQLTNTDLNANVIKKFTYNTNTEVNVKSNSATTINETADLSDVSEFVIEPNKRIVNAGQTDSINLVFSVCDKKFSDLHGKVVNANAKARITLHRNGNCS